MRQESRHLNIHVPDLGNVDEWISSLTICSYAPNEHLTKQARETESEERVERSMELALGAMAGLAPKLGDLLVAEYVVQKGLKPDILSLSDELVMMNAALVDASRIPPDQLTEVQKLWARKLRELSLDTEDAVDDFVLRVACGNSAAADTDANVFKKILGKATAPMKKFKDRRQISDRVKDIKKLSSELAELRDKYTVKRRGSCSCREHWHRPPCHQSVQARIGSRWHRGVEGQTNQDAANRDQR